MGTIRNVFRRKARAFLTIFGITIGVLALVVMGAMAEKLQLLVDGGVEYYGDKVMVTEDAGSGMMSPPMSVGRVRELERADGVERASASVTMLLDEDADGMSMGMPPMIVGDDMRSRGYETFELTTDSGRLLEPGDSGSVVVGADIVDKLGATLGGTVELRGERFVVVGILERTLTAPDKCAYVPMADAQRLFAEDLPGAIRDNVRPADLCTEIAVYPAAGVDPERLAKKLEGAIDGIKASGPSTFKEQVADAMRTFNSIIYGVAAVSLLVGGLSVINTMTMAVSERTREIGIRKAIGAGTGRIMRQFIAESALIGLVGGVAGLALGALIAYLLNAAGAASSNELFLVTGRLAAGSVGFALVLGVVSGLYPAWHAAQLSPVRALRFE